MPYVKFASQKEEFKFRNVLDKYLDNLVDKTCSVNIPGRRSIIADKAHGIVFFYRRKVYHKSY